MDTSVSKKFISSCQQQTRKSYVQAILGDLQKNILASVTKRLGTSIKNSFIISFETDNVSDSTGSLYNSNASLYPAVSLKFQRSIKVNSPVLYFESEQNSVSVSLLLNGNLIDTRDLVVNNKGKYKVNFGSNINCNEIKIVFYESKPNTKGKISNITVDDYIYFEDNVISDYDIQENLSLDTSEISSREMTLEIVDKEEKYSPTNPNNKLSDFAKGTIISLVYFLETSPNIYESILLGIFRVNDYDRNYANKTLKINCYDDLYFLNQEYIGTEFDSTGLQLSDGTINHRTIMSWLTNVFKYFNYTNYTMHITDNFNLSTAGTIFKGYVPKNTFRETLKTLCENFGFVLKTTRYNEIFITNIKNISVFYTNFYFTRQVTNSIVSKYVFSETPKINSNYINNLILENPSWKPTLATASEEEIYQHKFDNVGTYVIEFEPIYHNTLTISSKSTAIATIVSQSAETAVINITSAGELILKGTPVKFYASNYDQYINANTGIEYSLNRTFTWVYTDEEPGAGYNVREVSNDIIKDFKLNAFKPMAYELECLMLPYIETGDIIHYVDKNKNVIELTVSQIGFTKSMIQTLRGE